MSKMFPELLIFPVTDTSIVASDFSELILVEGKKWMVEKCPNAMWLIFDCQAMTISKLKKMSIPWTLQPT